MEAGIPSPAIPAGSWVPRGADLGRGAGRGADPLRLPRRDAWEETAGISLHRGESLRGEGQFLSSGVQPLKEVALGFTRQ